MQEQKINLTRGFGLLENFLAKKRAAMANSLVPSKSKKGKVLDVGCGSYPYFLINSGFKEKHGIDPSLDARVVNGIRGDMKLKKVRIGNTKLPFKDNYFDAVTMLAVFEHIDHEKLPSVLSEIKRMLKNGGTFVITTPSPWSDKVLHFLANFGLISKEEIHEHKHNLTHKKIREYLEEAGFSRKKIQNGFFEVYMNMWFKSEK